MTGRSPYCECGYCDATGRKGGDEILLPQAAWVVAGGGDIDRIAVAPGHEQPYVDLGTFVVEDFGTWLAIAEATPQELRP